MRYTILFDQHRIRATQALPRPRGRGTPPSHTDPLHPRRKKRRRPRSRRAVGASNIVSSAGDGFVMAPGCGVSKKIMTHDVPRICRFCPLFGGFNNFKFFPGCYQYNPSMSSFPYRSVYYSLEIGHHYIFWPSGSVSKLCVQIMRSSLLGAHNLFSHNRFCNPSIDSYGPPQQIVKAIYPKPVQAILIRWGR